MKKLFSFILIISMMLGTVAYAADLTDINKTHWAYNDIQLGIEKGFFSCYPDGSFKPERNLTRAEAIKVITEFLGRTVAKPTESEFTDLDINSWYAPYIHVSDFLFPEKWIDEKLIKADKPITREEAVYALITAMRYDYKKADADLSLLKGFKDKEKIGFGLEPYMALALEFGVVSGYQDNTLRPDANITRGEFAALMSRVSKQNDILNARREQVLDYMSKNAGVLWKSDKDFDYVLQSGITPEEASKSKVLHIKKDRIYRGVIYSYASGDISSFLDYSIGQDENGVHTISGLDWQDVSTAGGSSSRTALIGNDCGGAAQLALGSIGHDIAVSGVTKLSPNLGYPRVGKYKSSLDYNRATLLFCYENGEDVMYKAYSQLKKGDLMCWVSSVDWSSHVRMVADVKVVYDENGKIDPEKSLIICHDQTKGNLQNELTYYDEKLGCDVYYIGEYNSTKFSFKENYNKGYIPTTVKILIDPSPIPKAEVTDSLKEHNIDNLFKGTINSNWMIDKAQIEISDSSGNVVQKSSIAPVRTPEPQYGYIFKITMSKFNTTTEQGLINGKIDVSLLPKGEYNCKVKIRLVSDEEFTVREFNFQR